MGWHLSRPEPHDKTGSPTSQALGWDHQPGTLGWPGLQALVPDFSGSFERDKGLGFPLWSRSWGRSSKEEISKSLSSSESYGEVRGRRKCILTREDRKAGWAWGQNADLEGSREMRLLTLSQGSWSLRTTSETWHQNDFLKSHQLNQRELLGKDYGR